MSRSRAPALISSVVDINEYKIADGEASDRKEETTHFAERFIHSEIYKRFKSVNAVVHAHPSDILPFCVTDVPLKPMIHTAGFLGYGPRLWDQSGGDLLVNSSERGHDLTNAFKNPQNPVKNVATSVWNWATGKEGEGPAPQEEPDACVALMRGHGMAVIADSLESVVYRSIYAIENARVQLQAVLMTRNLQVEVKVGENGEQKSHRTDGRRHFLGTQKSGGSGESEIEATAKYTQSTCMRAWELWVREVEVNPLYQNEVKVGEEAELVNK